MISILINVEMRAMSAAWSALDLQLSLDLSRKDQRRLKWAKLNYIIAE
jgi:hypothetical protein